MAAPKGNKFALGNKGGKPPVYNSKQELEKEVAAYFTHIEGEKKQEAGGEDKWIREPEPATVTGLALYLGFESRQSMYDYEKKEEYSYIIKRARMVIEQKYEKNLSANNPAGSIFALKNMGWQDKQALEHTGKDGESISITLDLK